MDADAVAVDPRVRHEPAHAGHLVLHLALPALFVYGLLVLGSAVRCAAVVHDEDYVSALCHVHLPAAQLCLIAVAHHLRMWAAVDIEYDGVFLGGVEAEGLD